MSLAAVATVAVSLERSRQYCEQLARSEARNFYYGMKLLPQPRRCAMFALYAYMRLVDDIADGLDGQSVAQRRAALDAWAASTQAATAGQVPADGQPLWPAFVEMVQRYAVPPYVFSEVIAAQRQDLDGAALQTFEDLKQYCYRVAGVVGVASIHIFGFEGAQATIALAIDRGIAFQLTNILRDLREDARRGRVYLPQEELAAAGVSAADLCDGRGTQRFGEMMSRQIERARQYYQKSAPLEERIERDSRPTLAAMTQIYRELLEKIAADPTRVLRQRVSLSPLSKLRIAWRAARARG